MKLPHHRIYFLAGILLLVLAGLLASDSWNTSFLQQASHSLKQSAEQLSRVAQHQSGKIKKKSAHLTQKKDHLPKDDVIGLQAVLHAAAPLYQPSAKELREFPGARVVEAAEVSGPNKNETTRVRILQTHFKYPAIRTEEVIDNESGNLIAREEMVANHLLVSLNEGEDPQVFLKKLRSLATGINHVVSDTPLYNLTLQSSSLSSLPEAMNAIAALGGMEKSEPDFIGHACFIPNDPAVQSYNNPNIQPYWNWSFSQNNYQWGLFKIDAPAAWEVRTSAKPIVVAVLDTGIRYTHQDLAANMWHNPAPTNNDIYGWNAVANNGDPMDDNVGLKNFTMDGMMNPMQCHGHGTLCAGIIGAVGNNGVGICGVAWQVQLMACKWMDAQGSGTSSDVISCIHYACDHGANIINCSWMFNVSWTQASETNVFAALQYAQQKGVIAVAAAGNESNNNDFCPEYPSSYGVAHPGQPALDNIVAVAATTSDDDFFYIGPSEGSNYGVKSVSIAAPGVDIYSTAADSDSSYASESGTSFAAPHVVGALALMMAQFPNHSYQQLIERLYTTADKIPALNGKVGYGRLNVAKALGYKASSIIDLSYGANY